MKSSGRKSLIPHLTPMQAWGFALGTAVGWGSLVVTANSYLAQAGPWGSAIGLIIGMAVMLVVARNYAYLMNIHPEPGGAYAYSREVFGHDHGFLTGWFLALTYLAILWANATSVPLFFRNFAGNWFRFGRMYTLFGYDVYIGEALLTIACIFGVALLCIRGWKAAVKLMPVCAFVYIGGIAVVLVSALLGLKSDIAPGFLPDPSELRQIIAIAVISPWAFIGFECISHASAEFSFPRTKSFKLLAVSVVSATALYVALFVLSVTAYPARYDSWLAYIRDLGACEGLEAFPAFYAAQQTLGGLGVGLLMAALLALVLSSLIGNTMALSRLFYALGRDKVLPGKFGELNEGGEPARAIMLIACVSAVIPFAGRTAVGWIVDVTTIGATLIYGFVSAAAAKTARLRKDRRERMTGLIGLILMVAFGCYILLPNLVGRGSMAKETYFLFIVWTLLGFLFFRNIMHRDTEQRFGKSLVVWVVLLFLVLFVSLVWMRQSVLDANDRMQANVEAYYEQRGGDGGQREEDTRFVEAQMDQLETENVRTVLISLGMFSIALVIMLSNHAYMNRRNREHEIIANVDPLTGVKSKHAYLLKEKEIDAAIKAGDTPEFGIVVGDVNGLKHINDTQGHKAGDEYIRKASQLICEIFRHSPVYRIGGDEFVMILTGRDYENRTELLKELHECSVRNIGTGDVVVSGGLSVCDPDRDESFHTVFERADKKMYEEKQLLKGMGSISRDEVSPKAASLPIANQGTEPLLVRRTVLVVEDVEINRLLLGAVLENNYDILYAEDGDEALKVVRENRDVISTILLDLQMPRMGGREVLLSLNGDPELRRIPVIILTGDQDAEVECLRLGAMDFIPKPYPDAEIIRARVDKCTELYESRSMILSTERDQLTGLYNVDYFDRYVSMFDRHYADLIMDAVAIDINHFHMINERYGKEYGDAILQRLGARIREAAREMGGVGCHRGADSFLLYCPGQEDYAPLLERLSDGLGGEDAEDRVRLRMGVYPHVDKTLELSRRFDRAKLASDSVRGNHMNPIGFYNDELHQTALMRSRLLEDFRSSLDQNRFKVFFQPKFDIRPGKPVLSSAEALVRWIHPELGFVNPGQFIPLLEESGLILELDRFVWRETAAQIRRWKDAFGFSVPVSVNVSRIDMLSSDLRSVFAEILEQNRLSADDLILEITESAYTGDSAQVINMARDLRGMGLGFRIEMDDFGTGYSSLGMLTQLPIDALKLDMTFVRSAFGETRDVRMIELIIDIADYLHVPVVAEGVETEEQLLVLKALGCDLVQGYYFSKPVPAEEFERFLLERQKLNVRSQAEPRVSYQSLTKALTYEYDRIYYIDLSAGSYLEFSSGEAGELRIRPDGVDFFGTEEPRLLEGADPEEAEKLRAVLTRDALRKTMETEETVNLSWRRGGEKPGFCRLRSLLTRNPDDHHLTLGFRMET